MKPLLLVTVLALFIPALACAQAVVDYEVRGGSGSKNNAGVLVGQSFTTNAGAFQITSLDLYVNRNGLTSGSNFTVSLYATTGGAASYTPTGAALFSQTYSNDLLSATTGTDYTFSGLNWAVSGSTTYLVAIESTALAAIKWTVNLATGGDVAGLLGGYSGQNRYVAGTGVVSGSYFAMAVTTAAIPEPAIGAAGAGAAALGLAVLRRRRV